MSKNPPKIDIKEIKELEVFTPPKWQHDGGCDREWRVQWVLLGVMQEPSPWTCWCLASAYAIQLVCSALAAYGRDGLFVDLERKNGDIKHVWPPE